MAKHLLKESTKFSDTIKSKGSCNISKGGSEINREMNIFEKENIIKKAEEIKESFKNSVYKSKKIILKGITLGTALSIIMSSVAFGGEHTVDNWEDYKQAIVEDIMKQDSNIIIYYRGEDKFSTKEEVSSKLRELFDEVIEEGYSTFESQNYFGKKTSGNVKTNEDGTYSLNKGTYTVTYKNSKEELEEVEAIIDSFIEENIDDSMSDYDKVKAIYDFIIDSYVYGSQRTSDDDIEGILRERNVLLGLDGEEVVCDAFAMLFSKMATRLGYNNMIINGKADGISHAWNLIEIDGQWYHVDATWGNVDIEEEIEKLKEDNPDLDESIIREVVENHAKEERGKYLLTSDSVIAEKHSWDEGKYPSALESYNIGDAVEKEIRNQINAINDSIQTLNTNVYELEDRIDAIENVTQIQNLREEIQQYYEDIDSIRNQIDTIRENMQELEEDTINELEHDLAQLELFLLDKLKAGLDDASVLLDEKEIEIQNQLIQQAIDAVALAETTKSQANVDAARELVSYLPEIEIKNSLLQRLDVVQAEIDIQNLISIIEEQIINLTDINNSNEIQEAINTLPEGEEKDRLQRQLNSKIEELKAQEELNRQIQEAIEAVELAERTKTQENVDLARDLVNQLPDCPEKDDLLERINIIEDKINTPEEPQETEEPSEDEENDEEEEPEDPEESEEPTDEEEEENDEEESSDEEEQNEEEPQEPEEPSDGEDEEDEQDEEEPIDEEDEQNQENPEEPLDEEEEEEQEEEEEEEEEEDEEDEENSSDDEEPSEDEEPVDDNEDEEEEQNEEDEENEQDEEADEPENPSDEEQEEQEDEDNEQDEEPEDEESEDEEPEDEEPKNEEPEDKEPEDEEPEDKEPEDEEPEDKEPEDEEPEDKEPEEKRPNKPIRPSRPIINRPERLIVRENEKKEEKPVVKDEIRDDVKSKEEIRKENLKISKEKINELNTILKIIPNMNATITVGNIEINPDVKPYIYKEKEEKILVPIRFVAEALGFEVNWSKNTWSQGIKKIFLSYQGKGIIMEIGKDLAYVNGKPVKMDFVPELKDSRTYVTLDFIVEILETSFNYENIGGKINLILSKEKN